MKILVINGANLDKLDFREKSIYGGFSLQQLESELSKEFPEMKFTFFQSNSEGAIVDRIHGAGAEFDGLIINPGGYSHTSVVIRDALEIENLTKIEVHISNLSTRENFRQKLLTASVCDGYLSGFKLNGYLAAVYLIKLIKEKND